MFEDSAISIENPKIVELLREKGWRELTTPQKLAIPKIKEGYNVLIIAPTGYGKTEAAILPVFEKMIEEKAEPVAVVYITPLRALINDITRRLRWWGSRLGFTVARKHGDVPSSEKAKRLRKAPHVIVTTPESLEIDLDWAQKFRSYYRNVKWVIVDEVHELISSKRGIQLILLLERLRKLTNYDFQRIGLSATIGDPEKVAKFLFGSSKRKSVIIEIGRSKKTIIEVDAVQSKSDDDLWEQVAKTIIEHIEPPSLIFVNSRSTAERLHEYLEKTGLKEIQVHHSSVSRNIRVTVEKDLLEGKLKGVVCTKTLELGIDIGDIKKVIQFRPPGSVTTLLQRVGRSGHKFYDVSKGAIIGLNEVDILETLATISLALRNELEEPQILEKPLDVLAREILGIVLQYGEVDAEMIYEIISKAYAYKTLSFEELTKLLKYMEANGLLSKVDNSKYKIGPTFFKIWRFDTDTAFRRWWARSFTEFFTTIGERPSFQVKHGDIIVGDVDSQYVYRYLRVGDVVRLSGRNWKIVDVDDISMKISVIPASTEEAEVPIWRGEGARRSKKISYEVGRLLHKVVNGGKLDLPENVKVFNSAIFYISKLYKAYRGKEDLLPDEKTMVIEKHGDETVFLFWMGQNIAETLAHIIMYLISTKYTLNVYVKSSYVGFSVRVRNIDPVKILLDVTPSKVERLVELSLERSPLYYAILKELQVSFGKIGKLDPEKDSLIIEEAKRQVKSQYMDVEGAKELLRKIHSGEINLVYARNVETPLGKYVKELPPIRPWIKDASLLIVETLENMALTVDELSEILELPSKTIENKLKDLRKPDVVDRVFQFIDIDIGEWRWALIKDAKKIYESPEYRQSFEPYDVDEVYTLYIKPINGLSYFTLYFSAREIISNFKKFLERVPVSEAYEVRVIPSDSMLKTLTPRYFYVPKNIIPYVALNGITYMQMLKRSS